MEFPASPLQDWTGRLLDDSRQLLLKRDDLLPFPLPGNKFRKLSYELESVDRDHIVVTVGSVHSNHCRTTALMCAKSGLRCHLVLHDDGSKPAMTVSSTRILNLLGARYEIVDQTQISETIDRVVQQNLQKRLGSHVIEGGCHTAAGVQAYEEAVLELSLQVDEEPAYVFLASGTGATQAGLVVGCRALNWTTEVIGISVARPQARGMAAVMEAIAWRTDGRDVTTIFSDGYRAGGYGLSDERTSRAVELAWGCGLPTDPVYTGKALAGMLDMESSGDLDRPGPIVFWHTGGLFQALWG